MTTEEQLKRIQEALFKARLAASTNTVSLDAAKTNMPQHSSNLEAIAIVGLSGYLPKSRSVQDFWTALDQDLALIEEIPSSRFNWQQWYEPSGQDTTKSRSKWGGFIPDIAGFDHIFLISCPVRRGG